ncbi:MAG: hypothetical protein U9O90_03675 [Euryarchaeota archaeon]|nr:hypothetical protein [Euryarchaeota archaeon]
MTIRKTKSINSFGKCLTGLGSSINAIMSLTVTYKLPLPIIASWRGIYKEKIAAQEPVGKAMPKVLDALDAKIYDNRRANGNRIDRRCHSGRFREDMT